MYCAWNEAFDLILTSQILLDAASFNKSFFFLISCFVNFSRRIPPDINLVGCGVKTYLDDKQVKIISQWLLDT